MFPLVSSEPEMKFVFRNTMVFFMQLALLAINMHLHFADAYMGAIYGMQADNLPSPDDAVEFYLFEKIRLLRLFVSHPIVLESLRGKDLRVAIGVKNEDVPVIATNVDAAMDWVNNNIVPYASDVNFHWITVGNDMVPGPNAQLIFGAMNNIWSGLNAVNITNIQISTVVSNKVLQNASSPIPSTADFTNEARDVMQMIIVWLNGTNNPLFTKVDAYGAYLSAPDKIPLRYAIFEKNEVMLTDGKYEYRCLFEAMVDSCYVALQKNGGARITLVVGETGWPTAGNEPITSKYNAFNYNQGMVDILKRVGTPRIAEGVDTFIYSMFNENKKPTAVGQNWGINYPNMTMVYDLDFS